MPLFICDIDGATQTSGSALPSRGVQILGSDGTNSRLVLVDTQGRSVDTLPGDDSSGNSSTTPLGVGATFAGAFEDVSGYSAVCITVKADQASTMGGLKFQWSTNGTDVDAESATDLLANKGRAFSITPRGKYFRLQLVNGATAQTSLRLKVGYSRTSIGLISNPLSDALDDSNFAQTVRAVLTVKRPDDTYGPLNVDNDGNLQVQIATGRRLYHTQDFIAADTPATITSGNAGPFTVGGTTFSINVDGGGVQAYAFAARGATAGESISATNPPTTNGPAVKLKLSVDGGAFGTVTIAANLDGGAAVAAALQTAIQAGITNGAGVLVDYDVTHPKCYTITSGTTGTSSTVVTADSALKQALLFGPSKGGTELAGLAANSYRMSEVVELLHGGISGVDVYPANTPEEFVIQTIAAGTSASLQVSAGGSNTAFAFTTSLVSGSAGSGSTNLGVNGSVNQVRYALTVPTGYKFVVEQILFRIRDNAATTLAKFGGITQLTNGVLVEFKNEDRPIQTFFSAVTNAELFSHCDEGAIVLSAYSSPSSDDLVHARVAIVPGIEIFPSTSEGIFVTVRDDLSGLVFFRVTARGWLEAT